MQLVNDPRQQIDFYKAIYGKISPSGDGSYPALDGKNDMEYKHYRKFGAETCLVTDQK